LLSRSDEGNDERGERGDWDSGVQRSGRYGENDSSTVLPRVVMGMLAVVMARQGEQDVRMWFGRTTGALGREEE